MKTSENAPRTSGSVASAAASTPGWPAPLGGHGRWQRTAPSARRCRTWRARPSVPAWPVSSPASSSVLIRLPLWPSARLADGVARNVGCAFSQTEDPLVEYRQCADGDVPVQRVEHGLVEDLRDQAHVLVDHDPGAVADRDAQQTPGRGAGASTGRSRRAWPHPRQETRLRRRRRHLWGAGQRRRLIGSRDRVTGGHRA